MYTKKRSHIVMVTAVLLAGLLLAACSPAAAANLPEPTATSAPAPTAESVAEEPNRPPELSLDLGVFVGGYQTELIAAVPVEENAPYWEVLPEYTLVTLSGYLMINTMFEPRIYIYPLDELVQVNQGAGQVIASLQMLLRFPQEIDPMPFLPLRNEVQMMHTHLQYLDFKNGQGLRYLTEFSQGPMPVNNSMLIYTYQGITGDGKYYVAAVLPVNHPSIPLDGTITGNEPAGFADDFPKYVADVVASLNPQAADTFTPDLTALDAIMSSLEIR